MLTEDQAHFHSSLVVLSSFSLLSVDSASGRESKAMVRRLEITPVKEERPCSRPK